MAPMCGTGTFTSRPADSPTRSPLGLAVVKAVEEVNATLVAAEAVGKAEVDSKAVAGFGAVTDSKAVDVATIMITTVVVAKVLIPLENENLPTVRFSHFLDQVIVSI